MIKEAMMRDIRKMAADKAEDLEVPITPEEQKGNLAADSTTQALSHSQIPALVSGAGFGAARLPGGIPEALFHGRPLSDFVGDFNTGSYIDSGGLARFVLPARVSGAISPEQKLTLRPGGSSMSSEDAKRIFGTDSIGEISNLLTPTRKMNDAVADMGRKNEETARSIQARKRMADIGIGPAEK